MHILPYLAHIAKYCSVELFLQYRRVYSGAMVQNPSALTSDWRCRQRGYMTKYYSEHVRTVYTPQPGSRTCLCTACCTAHGCSNTMCSLYLTKWVHVSTVRVNNVPCCCVFFFFLLWKLYDDGDDESTCSQTGDGGLE